MGFVPLWQYRRCAVNTTRPLTFSTKTEPAASGMQGTCCAYCLLMPSAVWAWDSTDHLQCSQHLCCLYLGRYLSSTCPESTCHSLEAAPSKALCARLFACSEAESGLCCAAFIFHEDIKSLPMAIVGVSLALTVPLSSGPFCNVLGFSHAANRHASGACRAFKVCRLSHNVSVTHGHRCHQTVVLRKSSSGCCRLEHTSTIHNEANTV